MEDYLEKYKNYKLCYVESSEYISEPMTLHFTELNDVTEQWGDDWNNAPYEHNAGCPYHYDYDAPEQGVKNGRGIYPKRDIIELVLGGHYTLSTPRTGVTNSKYCVEDINKGLVPWINIKVSDKEYVHIMAGTTLKEVIGLLKKYIEYPPTMYIEIKCKEED